MKRFLSLMLIMLLLVSLCACEEQGGSEKLKGELLLTVDENPIPIRVGWLDNAWVLIRGTYGQTGQELAVGESPDSAQTVYRFPDASLILSFCSENGIAVMSVQTESDGIAVYLYNHKAGTVSVIGSASTVCPRVAILAGTAIWVNDTGDVLMRYDPDAQENTQLSHIAEVNGITALTAEGNRVIWSEKADDGRYLVTSELGKPSLRYLLPDAISSVSDIAYDESTGTYALCYQEAANGYLAIGNWFVTSTTVHKLFSFGEDYQIGDHEIDAHGGSVYWITAASIPGMTQKHHRIIVWNTLAGMPSEYMKAFAFALGEKGLAYLTMDLNHRTDRVSIYLDASEDKIS